MRSHTVYQTFRYAPGLDGVRALAVLAVFAYHVGVTGGGAHILSGGFLGVDVFFVLSGYLITNLLMIEVQTTRRVSIRNFYVRRARRLLPAVIALLFAVAAIAVYWLPEQAARMRGDLVAALSYVTNWWLIASDSSYFGGGERPSLLTHLWSLAVEEQFYLIWPLVIIVLARLRPGRRTVLIGLGVAVVASTVAAALIYDPWTDPSRVYYGTDTRALAPLLGAALAFALRSWQARPSLPGRASRIWNAAGILALAGLGAVAVLLGDNDPALYRGGFLVIAILAAIVVTAAGHPATWLGRALGHQPLRWLGQRSYAFYLWHWPVCVLTRPGSDVPVTGWANTALRLAITLALAEISYWVVERPFRKPHGAPAPARRPARRTAPRMVLRPALRPALLSLVLLAGAATLGYQLTERAREPVNEVPVDAGPDLVLGPLDTGAVPIPKPAVSTKPGAGPGGTTTPPTRPRPTGPPPRVAWFGDSQGMSLLSNKPADTGKYVAITDATIGGCGILLGRVTSRTGERRDQASNCPNWLSEWSGDARRIKADVAVIMIGAWELFDLTTEAGARLTFGTADWDGNFTAALTSGITAIRGSGATVALALLPCYRPVRASAGYWPERGDDTRTRHVNSLLRAAADGEHVFVLEPPMEFCSDPVIAKSVNYRWDGVHYYKPGAALYLKHVLPQLLDLPRRQG